MKVSPLASGAAASVNPNEGRSASPDRLARAKAVMSGGQVSVTPVETAVDPQVARAQADVKKIQMRTNASPVEAPVIPDSNIPHSNEASAVEETKPLSPQLAALAKQKRAVQVKEAAIEAREKALAEKEASLTANPDLESRLKASPLRTLLDMGVTYNQLTEEILSNPEQNANPGLTKLEAELNALKKAMEDQTTSLSDRDKQAKEQVKSQILKEAQALSKDGEDYWFVRETGSQQEIVDRIEKHFDQTGDLRDTQEVAAEVEKELAEYWEKLGRAEKAKSRLVPAQQQPQAAGPQRPVRTLTSRDGSSSNLSARERAILAFQGRLTK